MRTSEWIRAIEEDQCEFFLRLYGKSERQKRRFRAAIRAFEEKYGADREVSLFSTPGRTEISGNHTDHNHGCVLAGAVNRDIIAVAAKTNDGEIRLQSEGCAECRVALANVDDPKRFEPFRSDALIAGMCGGLHKNGYKAGGFVAYTTSEVPRGSGLSSSAAFEVLVGTIENHFYNDGAVDAPTVAKIAQYAENVYFGKPCGLMDQMACAVGGFVFLDFFDPKKPLIRPIDFSLEKAGYMLAIVNTGGCHSDLNADYAAVPAEMKAVASYFGEEVLRGITEAQLIENAPILRRAVGDRALLRALHFVRENDRVGKQAKALTEGRIADFLAGVLASGRSSFEYLQNVYTTANPAEQGLSLALAVTEGALAGKDCAWRVHGGGFAGTIQTFLRADLAEGYAALMDAVFEQDACLLLSIRPEGGVKIEE